MLILGAALGGCYFLFHRPLAAKTKAMDGVLRSLTNELLALDAASQIRIQARTRSEIGVEWDTITNNFLVAEKSVRAMTNAAAKARQRLEPDPFFLEKIHSSFSSSDFELNQRELLVQARKIAETNKIKVEESVFSGYTEPVSNTDSDTNLWRRLYIFDQVFRVAAASAPQHIISLTHLSQELHPPIETRRGPLIEYPPGY